MGYQPRVRSPRNSGRGRGIPRREKAKAKAARRKRRSSGSYMLEGKHVSTSEEVADRTLSRLRNLGNQKFVLSPFNEHFDPWLGSLRDVLSEFESNPAVSVDDQFVKDRSQILSNVELKLEERRRQEASSLEVLKSLSDNRILLERTEKEYTARTKEIEERKRSEIKSLSSNMNGLKEELDRLARTKTGIFRAMSKKAKAQKEAEANQRLNLAQRELASAMQRFTAEQERLRDEYERRKQPITEQMRDQQKKIEDQEIDGSLEARQAACEALANAVNALKQRKVFSPP
jgi:DNA segregation ATPase FtsK/SpoIIIE-like protein